MSEPTTAADQAYADRVVGLYDATKQQSRGWADWFGLLPTDAGTRRPGIPGTLKKLNTHVQALIAQGEYVTAAQLIEAKVRKAYGVWDA